MSDDLPDGWATTSLIHVIDNYQSGFASGEKAVKGGVAQLRMNNIGLDGSLVLDLVRTVPKNLVRSQYDLRHGDVIVCTTNSGKLVGKCAIFDLSGQYTFSNHLTRLRPNSKVIEGSYLRWNLWMHWKLGTFNDQCKHWVNQSTLPKEALLETDIPLAPLAEQQRIVAKLKAVLEKVNACQQRLARIPTLLKRFRQSVLAAACSGRLTADWRETSTLKNDLPSIWSKCHLNDICELITKGASPKWQGVSYATHGVLFVTSENIGQGKMLLDSRKYVETKINKIQPRSVLRKGDLLTNIVGASIGRTAIFESDEVANINQAVALIRLRSDIHRKYILYLLNSPTLIHHMDEEKVDVARANLSLKDVAGFPIALPPLAEQQEIVRRVEALFAVADRIEARYAKAQAQVDRLTPALLAKAFRGELVPQDPNDEPASVLLERIRAQAPVAKPKKRRTKS